MQSLWMLFASFTFSIMGVCVRLASELYSTSEIVMYRGLIGMVIMLGWILLQGGTLKTAFPWHHAWRGVIGVIALGSWFYAIGNLPLATAMTLNHMVPIWIAAIVFAVGFWQGHTRFEWGLTAAILLSFMGVTMLLRPSFQAEQWFACLIGLASGAVSALAYLQVKKLGQLGEPEYRVVFYFSVASTLAGLLGTMLHMQIAAPTPYHWGAHSTRGLLLLTGIGVTATVAQMALTRAYRLGKTLVTANLQYAGIVFSSVWGMVLWDDPLQWASWCGMAIIIISGITVTYHNFRTLR